MQLACDRVLLIYSGFTLQGTTELFKRFATYDVNVTESQTERGLEAVLAAFWHTCSTFLLPYTTYAWIVFRQACRSQVTLNVYKYTELVIQLANYMSSFVLLAFSIHKTMRKQYNHHPQKQQILHFSRFTHRCLHCFFIPSCSSLFLI